MSGLLPALRFTGTALAVAGLCGCFGTHENWSAVVYPDGGNLALHFRAGEHPSLEACRAVATGATRALRDVRRGLEPDYECGKNCREHEGGTLICETTTR